MMDDIKVPLNIEEKRKYIKTLTDQDVLKAHFESKNENWGVRLQALVNIKDDAYLEQVAIDTKYDWTFRKEAMERIDSQAKLFEMAKTEKQDELKHFLVSRLKVRPLLKELKHIYIKNKTDPKIIAAINDQLETANNSISFIFED